MKNEMTSYSLTEALIVAWLRDQCAMLALKDLRLSVNSTGSQITASVPQAPGVEFCRDYGFGETVAEALEKMLDGHKSPAVRAAELRAQADAIEREAHL
jgi:hypothetical protein